MLTALALAGKLLHLPAHLLHLGEGALHGLVVLAALAVLAAGDHGLLHLLQLIAEIIQAGGDLGFSHHRILTHAAADPVGVALHAAGELGLLHVAQGLPHFGGGLALGALQIAHGGLHALLELLQLADLVVALSDDLSELLARRTVAGRIGAPQLAFEVLLFAGQLIGLAGKVFHLVAGLRAAHAGEHLLRFFQTVGRTAGLGLALRCAGLLGGRGASHVVGGLLEAIEHLLELPGIGLAQLAVAALLLVLLLLCCWPC